MREKYFGNDGGDVEGAGSVPPLCGSEDRRYVIWESWGGWMGVIIGGRGIRSGRDVDFEGIYLEAAG